MNKHETPEAAVQNLSQGAAIAEPSDSLDAQRYRWLLDGQVTRNGVTLTGFRARTIDKDHLRSLLSFTIWCEPDEADAAIDAALSASKAKP